MIRATILLSTVLVIAVMGICYAADPPKWPLARITLDGESSQKDQGVSSVLIQMAVRHGIYTGIEIASEDEKELSIKVAKLGVIKDMPVTEFYNLISEKYQLESITSETGITLRTRAIKLRAKDLLGTRVDGIHFKGNHEAFMQYLRKVISVGEMNMSGAGADDKAIVVLDDKHELTLRQVLDLYAHASGTLWRAQILKDDLANRDDKDSHIQTSKIILSFIRLPQPLPSKPVEPPPKIKQLVS